MNINQRALLHAFRSCTLEALRADRQGKRRYAGQLRASSRRALAQAAVEGSDPLVKAISCIKNAAALGENLPDRADDPSSHDERTRTMHGEVQSGRQYLEQHLWPAGLLKSRRRRHNRESGTPASGTDENLPYAPTDGDSNLTRAIGHIRQASFEADKVPAEDDGETNAVANNMHYHVRNADELLAAYRSTVIDSPQAEGMRSRARAWAATVMTGLH
jgi:hypothetical protein